MIKNFSSSGFLLRIQTYFLVPFFFLGVGLVYVYMHILYVHVYVCGGLVMDRMCPYFYSIVLVHQVTASQPSPQRSRVPHQQPSYRHAARCAQPVQLARIIEHLATQCAHR